MVLQNYVILQPGRPTRLHFTSHDLIPKTITDPVTMRPKQVNTLVFQADEMDGKPIAAQYSIVSQKHANDFRPFLPGERYKDYDFIITMSGEGFRREYQISTMTRVK